MAFTVIYDANVLYPAPLRDLLVRLGRTGLVRVRWTNDILDEVFRNIIADRPDLDLERLARTRQLMNDSIRDVLVDGHQPLIGALDLPDENDRHVLAAAIKCGAQAIITLNLKDFPAIKLGVYGVEAVHPDDFVLDLLDLAPGAVLGMSRSPEVPYWERALSIAELVAAVPRPQAATAGGDLGLREREGGDTWACPGRVRVEVVDAETDRVIADRTCFDSTVVGSTAGA